MKLDTIAARCAALAAIALFAACSSSGTGGSTPPTHPPVGDQPSEQLVIANASGKTISPIVVNPDECWTIDPPFPTVAAGTDSQPVRLVADKCDPHMSVSYGSGGQDCTLDVSYFSVGRTYTSIVEQGSATKCTASSTGSGELFTYALKSQRVRSHGVTKEN
jgi:hypothetical protein